MQDGVGGEKPFALGILFVHGIGTQSRGQTLTAFGGSLYRWLQWRCEAVAQSPVLPDTDVPARRSSDETLGIFRRWEQKLEIADWEDTALPENRHASPSTRDYVLHRAVLRKTTFQDPADAAVPAHAEIDVLSLDSNERVFADKWLLAESWWANSFSSPSFADLVRWGFGVWPWIVGSHFAAQVQRRLREYRHEPKEAPASASLSTSRKVWTVTTRTWRLAVASGGLAFGLLSTVITIPLLALMLVLGLLPIPKLRSALLQMQLQLASTLGDCFVLLARPIEAAAIVSAVRQNLQWLATRCSEVVVVAHSQGGAVAHLALRGPIPKELKLLFTFGSGLRKLEEARELMRSSSSFALSAGLTSIALVMLVFCPVVLIFVTNEQSPLGSVVTFALLGAASVVVFAAGVRDHLKGVPLPQLDRWIDWLGTRQIRWRDCYATADPVPNGVVAVSAEPLTRDVCNQSSALSDHTSYWDNLDEFASVVYDEIAQARTSDPLPRLRTSEPQFQRIAKRRRWRIAIGRFIQWTAATAFISVLLQRSKPVQDFATWAWSHSGPLTTGQLSTIGGARTTPYSVDWITLGLLALVLTPYLVLRAFWKGWNQREMKRALSLRYDSGDEGVVLTGLWIFVLIVAMIVRRNVDMPLWLATLAFLPAIAFMLMDPELRVRSATLKGRAPAPLPADNADETWVGALVAKAITLGMLAAMPFAVGWAGWDAVVWLRPHVMSDTLLPFRLETIPGEAVGGLAVFLAAVGWLLWTYRRPRAFQGETSPPDTIARS